MDSLVQLDVHHRALVAEGIGPPRRSGPQESAHGAGPVRAVSAVHCSGLEGPQHEPTGSPAAVRMGEGEPMRIRSITPSFYADDKTTGVWPVDQKFVYLGLISVADDWGRMEWRPRKIRAAIFPYEEGGLVSAAGPAVDFGACCRAIAAAGRLRLYSVNGQEYACLPTLRAHHPP